MLQHKIASSSEVRQMGLENRGRILIIYPHPDDEVFSCGGLIQKLVKSGIDFTVVVLSKGSATTLKFTKEAKCNINDAREREFFTVMKFLGVRNFDIWDFDDGKMSMQAEMIRNRIQDLCEMSHFTTLITYEPFGAYGHPDHVALSEVVTSISQRNNYKLIYSTISRKFTFSKETLSMKDPNDNRTPLPPNYILKLSFKETVRKLFAMRLYKSQLKFRRHLFLNIKRLRFMKDEYFVVHQTPIS